VGRIDRVERGANSVPPLLRAHEEAHAVYGIERAFEGMRSGKTMWMKCRLCTSRNASPGPGAA
jgi:hypothetical protein